jgi:putative inorganic carbon (hco3(-)) transporter
LNIFAEAGIIGLAGYMGLWLAAAWLTWQTRRHPDHLGRCIAVGLLGTWAYLAVHSLTDNLYVNNVFLHLGVMFGILAILHGHIRTYSKVSI